MMTKTTMITYKTSSGSKQATLEWPEHKTFRAGFDARQSRTTPEQITNHSFFSLRWHDEQITNHSFFLMVTTPEQITNHFFFSLRWHDDDNYAWTIYKSFFFFFTMTWWWHLQRLWWCKTIFSYKDIGDADNETFQIDIIHSSIYKIICCQVRLYSQQGEICG